MRFALPYLKERGGFRLSHRRGFAAGADFDEQRLAELHRLIDGNVKCMRACRQLVDTAHHDNVHILHLACMGGRCGEQGRKTCQACKTADGVDQGVCPSAAAGAVPGAAASPSPSFLSPFVMLKIT